MLYSPCDPSVMFRCRETCATETVKAGYKKDSVVIRPGTKEELYG